MNAPRTFVAIPCCDVPMGTPVDPDIIRYGYTAIRPFDLREALQRAYLRKTKPIPSEDGLEAGVPPAA